MIRGMLLALVFILSGFGGVASAQNGETVQYGYMNDDNMIIVAVVTDFGSSTTSDYVVDEYGEGVIKELMEIDSELDLTSRKFDINLSTKEIERPSKIVQEQCRMFQGLVDNEDVYVTLCSYDSFVLMVLSDIDGDTEALFEFLDTYVSTGEITTPDGYEDVSHLLDE